MREIFIRSIIPGDEEALFRIYSDMELCLSSGARPVKNMSDAKDKMYNFIRAGDTFAVVHTETMKVIGVITVRQDVHRFNRNAYMLGYVLHRDWWGKGIMALAVEYLMKYLFKNMGADVVSAAHFVGNNQSKRVLEKCGFVYEGTMRKDYLRFDGAVLDSCIYSVTKEEWLAKNS
ncbi:MAG: GNAT family N-acetyltransferase [Oscillospiraceae bacterium]|nr:GNAT family N-acetyltransferase [Oscillospiraceae bacterium]MBQ6849671.1 GNAT family N-acetyltransferase [Oscillospiraceae bacterium]